MKKYSKDDLIRQRITRTIIWALSLMMIIVGSKHIARYGITWEGVVIGLVGIGLSIMLNNAYENLLKEYDAEQKGDEQ